MIEIDKVLNPGWIVSSRELTSWAQIRGDNLSTFTGSPKWRNYLTFLEKKLLEFEAVDIFKNSWSFERWYTSDDSTKWSLVVGGRSVRVCHYDAYSGSTGPGGITAPLVYYDHSQPPQSLEGKICCISNAHSSTATI